MLPCSVCGQNISRIDAKVGAQMSGVDSAVICCTCAVLYYPRKADAGKPVVAGALPVEKEGG